MTSPCKLRYEQKQTYRQTPSNERKEAINADTSRRQQSGEITTQTALSAYKNNK